MALNMAQRKKSHSSHSALLSVLLVGAITSFIIALSFLTAIDNSYKVQTTAQPFQFKSETPEFSITQFKPSPEFSISDLLKAQVTSDVFSAEAPAPDNEDFLAAPPVSNFLYTAEATALEVTAEIPIPTFTKPQLPPANQEPVVILNVPDDLPPSDSQNTESNTDMQNDTPVQESEDQSQSSDSQPQILPPPALDIATQQNQEPALPPAEALPPTQQVQEVPMPTGQDMKADVTETAPAKPQLVSSGMHLSLIALMLAIAAFAVSVMLTSRRKS